MRHSAVNLLAELVELLLHFLEGPGCEFRPKNRTAWADVFRCSHHSLRAGFPIVHYRPHFRFLPNPFLLIIHLLPHRLTLYRFTYWQHAYVKRVKLGTEV